MQNRYQTKKIGNNRVYKDSNLIEIAQLQLNVDTICNKNQQKYKTIIENDDHFKLQLYLPQQSTRTQTIFKKQILLKQLDRLMDQQTILNKKIEQIEFKAEQLNQKQQNYLKTLINPHQVIRNVWLKHQNNSSSTNNCIQKIESLNFTVGVIKKTIQKMKNQQQSQIQQKIQTINNEKYNQLVQKYQQLETKNQQLQVQIINLNQQLVQKKQQINQMNRMNQDNDKQLKKIKKLNQISELDHKFELSDLKQKLLTMTKNLQKIQQWRQKLSSKIYQNSEKHFRIYIEQSNLVPFKQNFTHIRYLYKDLNEIKYILQNEQYNNLTQLTNLTQQTNAIKQNKMLNSGIQQQHQQQVPLLKLIQPETQLFKNKKNMTQRISLTLSASSGYDKFIQTKLPIKYQKIENIEFYQEGTKKFNRKTKTINVSLPKVAQFIA